MHGLKATALGHFEQCPSVVAIGLPRFLCVAVETIPFERYIVVGLTVFFKIRNNLLCLRVVTLVVSQVKVAKYFMRFFADEC